MHKGILQSPGHNNNNNNILSSYPHYPPFSIEGAQGSYKSVQERGEGEGGWNYIIIIIIEKT